MDSLFQSFNQQVSMNNFAELSGCVFSWIEEQCKPGDLQVATRRWSSITVSTQDLMFAILRSNGKAEDPLPPRDPIDPAYQRM